MSLKSHADGCSEHRRMARLSRRDALKVGVLGGWGLTLPDLLRHEAQAARSHRPRAKSVILLWMQGGVSHHETFDPKPDAPADIRGELHPIQTSMPGVAIGEYLPELARIMHKLAVIRSVRHSEAAHQRGSMYMVEGRRPPRATGVSNSGNPELGSIVAHELGMRSGMPPFVSIPGNDFTSRFTGPGFLPAAAGPFRGINSRTLAVPGDFSAGRFADRVSLRETVEKLAASRLERSRKGGGWDEFYDQAVDIVSSAKAAQAFDISEESDETKRAYGVIDASGKAIRGQMGTLSLTARRLVEAGVRYVTVGRNSWDHHSNIFPQLRSRLPRLDRCFAGLVNDLEQRGMLDETLVVYMTEYGRTPKVNTQAGRDHWPQAFSIAFAGAGIKPAQVIGASDSKGAGVVEDPVSPEEIAATILHLVGIDPRTEYITGEGRPIQYVDKNAEPLAKLIG